MPKTCLESSLGLMSSMLEVGVLVVDQKGGLACVTPLACELLGVRNPDAARKGWPALKSLLALDSRQFGHSGTPLRLTREFSAQGTDKILRLEIHSLGNAACLGLLVMIREEHALDAMDINLLLASRMCTQAYLYPALSHDMKTPLNAMQITLELLSDDLADPPAGLGDGRAPRTQRHVAALKEDFTRFKRALEASSALIAAPGTTPRHSFDLRDLVQELSRLLQPQARRQNVALNMLLPKESVLMSGPQDWVGQALLNVAVNGLAAMPEEGRLNIEVSATERIATVLINGDLGEIPEETLSRAYRLRFTPSRGELTPGLHVARAIVEALGGEFLIERDANSGTGFRLALPVD